MTTPHDPTLRTKGGTPKRTRGPTLTERELVKALQKLLKAYDSLMPGLPHIAVDDYALINEAPIEARRLVQRWKETGR